jgi:mannose-6-phosphate isomerase-like protein (cupin superfamily)
MAVKTSTDEGEERWLQGESRMLTTRKARREADDAKRKAGRKFISAADVRLDWEPVTGAYHGGIVSQDLGFDNRIIEVDAHLYPPHSSSGTHKHNEAIILVLRGRGYSVLDGERVDWAPGDTFYIAAGVWHQHHVTSDEPALVIAIKPIPLQEYLGEVHIIQKGDKPQINEGYKAGSFAEEFNRIGRD